MARIRTIKPDAFWSETLAEVSVATERTFVGLLTQADDKGRFKDRAAMLNGQLWSLRPEHKVTDMRDDLDDLCRVGLLCRYERGGEKYLHIPTWRKHQKINRPTPSTLPPCPTCSFERGGMDDEERAAYEAENQNVTALPLPGTAAER